MKKWFAKNEEWISGVSLTTLAFLAFGFLGIKFYNEPTYNEMRETVIKVADINSNNKIEVNEAISIYRSIGLDGKRIIKHLYLYSPLVTESEKKATIERFCEFYHIEKEYCKICNDYHYPSFYIEEVVDINRDGVIDIPEAETAFRIVYENKLIPLESFLDKSGSIIDYSELKKFVNIKGDD